MVATNVADLSFKVAGASPPIIARTYGQRHADFVNVKDYGALGDNSHDDYNNILDAFDDAIGVGTPHAEAGRFNNRPVFFPPGVYLTSTPFTFSGVYGGAIYGSGSRHTIIKYTGGSNPNPGDPGIIGLTSLLQLNTCSYSNFEGFTLDMLDLSITGVCFRLHADGTGHGAGNANSFRDVAFINGTIGTLLVYWGGGSPGTGSENLFVDCRWENNYWTGLQTIDGNALNNSIRGGSCHNCAQVAGNGALWGVTGSVPNIVGVRFSGSPAGYDIVQSDGGTLYVDGCTSVNPRFLKAKSAGCFVTNCYHNSATAAPFLTWSNDSHVVIENCHSVNGTIVGSGAATVYEKANRWDNASYLAGFSGVIHNETNTPF